VKLRLTFVAALLAASPALAEQPPGSALRPRLELERSNQAASVMQVRTIRSALGNEPRAARQIRISLDGSERAPLGATSVRRSIRLTLEESKSVPTFPPLDAFAAREVLDAESSGPVRSNDAPTARPLWTGFKEPEPRREEAARPIRAELSGDRVALSKPLPARRIRTTLD